MNSFFSEDKALFLPMKTILIVEDKPDVILSILAALGISFKVVLVTSLSALNDFLDAYVPGLIDAAIFDAKLDLKDHNSFAGLRRLRQAGFTGPILANSNTDNVQLLASGADAESTDKKKAGEQIISMMLERLVAQIPVPIRELIDLYQLENWDQLVSLIASLAPDQIVRLRGEMDEIRKPGKVPSRYVDGAFEVCTAIEHAEHPALTTHVPLGPEYDDVLTKLKEYLQ